MKQIAKAKRIMLLFILFLVALAMTAQERNIGFPRQSMSRNAAIHEITRQTGHYFAINHSLFDDTGIVTFTRQSLSLGEALDQLLMTTGHAYKIIGKQILIIPLTSEKIEEDSSKQEVIQTPVVTKQATNYKPVRNYINSIFNDPEFERELRVYEKAFMADVIEKKDTTIVIGKELDTIYNSKPVVYPSVLLSLVDKDKYASSSLSELDRRAPRFAIKTYILYATAALTPNLSLEFSLSKKMTLDISAAWNPFYRDGKGENNRKLVHFAAKPELRYWFCQRFNGHFLGIHPLYMQYNISNRHIPLLFEKEFRYEGHGIGGGVSYGYHFMLSKHWGMELNAGFGFAFLRYKKYACGKCTDKIGDFDKKYFGPTSLGIKVAYIIK